MALPWEPAGGWSVARFVFRRAFPMGTVFRRAAYGARAHARVATADAVNDVAGHGCRARLLDGSSKAKPPNGSEQFLFCRRCQRGYRQKVPTVNIYSIWVKRPKRCRGARYVEKN